VVALYAPQIARLLKVTLQFKKTIFYVVWSYDRINPVSFWAIQKPEGEWWVLYPNFGPKNTYSNCFSISDMCLLLLKITNLLLFYTDILLCFIFQFCFKNLFNCVFVYVLLHFKSSKSVSLAFQVIWICLWSIAYFPAHYFKFICKNHGKGYFSHFLLSNSF
jgi:hypothetical protein